MDERKPSAAEALHPNLPSALPEELPPRRSLSTAHAMYSSLAPKPSPPATDPRQASRDRYFRAMGLIRIGRNADGQVAISYSPLHQRTNPSAWRDC
jgi:hypothetical protein